GYRLVVDGQFVALVYGKRHAYGYLTGETAFAVGRYVREHQRTIVGLVGSKHLAPPALATAMDGVLAAVAVELYCIAIQHEAAVVYAVGHAAHGGTKGRRFGGIIVYMGKPLHHVTEFTRCIRHHQRNDPAAVVGYASLHAVCIADHVQVGRVTVYHRLEISSIQS